MAACVVSRRLLFRRVPARPRVAPRRLVQRRLRALRCGVGLRGAHRSAEEADGPGLFRGDLGVGDLRAGQEYIATLLVPQRDGGAIRDCRGQGLEDRDRVVLESLTTAVTDRKSTRLNYSYVG